jgi:hypothetical protein
VYIALWHPCEKTIYIYTPIKQWSDSRKRAEKEEGNMKQKNVSLQDVYSI